MGMPDYGIAEDFPQLWKLSQEYDFAQRLGAKEGTLEQEANRVLRELWAARRQVAESKS